MCVCGGGCLFAFYSGVLAQPFFPTGWEILQYFTYVCTQTYRRILWTVQPKKAWVHF